jgi:hypothetical protein
MAVTPAASAFFPLPSFFFCFLFWLVTELEGGVRFWLVTESEGRAKGPIGIGVVASRKSSVGEVPNEA